MCGAWWGSSCAVVDCVVLFDNGNDRNDDFSGGSRVEDEFRWGWLVVMLEYFAPIMSYCIIMIKQILTNSGMDS